MTAGRHAPDGGQPDTGQPDTGQPDTGQRAAPYVCPFCGEEDLRPAEQGRWHCRSCLRLFSVTFHGLAAPALLASPAPSTLPASPAPSALPGASPVRRGSPAR